MHFGHQIIYGYLRGRALEGGSEFSPKPLRELPGRIPHDAAAKGALWPSLVAHHLGAPDKRLESVTRVGHWSVGHFETSGTFAIVPQFLKYFGHTNHYGFRQRT